ncbi:MAG TPA: sugar ABC transporter permease [Atribacteraceae bacterium]|nr:sugar ABC transporter permease [Atribacteraceae bacterium]
MKNSPGSTSFLKSSRSFPYLLTLPVVVALVSLLFYPTVYAVWMSLTSTTAGSQQAVFVGLQNFQNLFANPGFWQTVWRTVLFTFGSVALSFGFGLALALTLNSLGSGVPIYQTIFILPIGVSPVVVGITWGMLLNPLYGVVNYLIGLVGVEPPEWTTSLSMALPTMILIDVWQWTPFVMLIIYAGLQMLPDEPFEAARIDGASSWQSFHFITVPLLRPIVTIALIFRGLEAFRAFDVIYAITRGGPGHATSTLIIRAYLESFRFHKLEVGATIGLVMLLVTLLISKRLVKVLDQ